MHADDQGSIEAPAAKAPDAQRRRSSERKRTRQVRGLKTESAILETTLKLIAKRGIRDTSLDLVARTVGVAKSSILWHFGSKEELLVRVAEHAFVELNAAPAKEALSLATFEERGDAMWRRYKDNVRMRPEFDRLMLYLILEGTESHPGLRERLRELYRERRRMLAAGLIGVIPNEMIRDLLATIMVAQLDGIFLQWILEPEMIDIDALQQIVRTMGRRMARAAEPAQGGG
jgi:AcrR family transcriptional regulator